MHAFSVWDEDSGSNPLITFYNSIVCFLIMQYLVNDAGAHRYFEI